MQEINLLLEQHRKKLKKGSSDSPTEVGPTRIRARSKTSDHDELKIKEESSCDYDGSGKHGEYGEHSKQGSRIAMDHTDAIGQIFAEFEFAYHNQYHKAFADPESLVLAKKYWLSNLEHYTPLQIVQAAKRVIASQEYLPSIAVVIQACEQSFALFGLPSSRQAYLEACSAPSPKRQQQWSHDAVYFAGNAAGWYLLANEPEAKAFPVFEYHYQLLCKRVINGQQLAIEVPPPLPDKVEGKMDKAERKARIAKLKQELGL